MYDVRLMSAQRFTLQFYLLGRFQILRDGAALPADAFVTKKAEQLLKICNYSPW
jgi:hypothetical protein